MATRIARSTIRAALIAAIFLGVSGVVTGSARAALSGGGGVDYQAGPGGQSTASLLGFVHTARGRGEFTFLASRFDNSSVGRGSSGLLDAAHRLAGGAKVRAQIAGAVGDETFRSWRMDVGPEIGWSDGRTLGVFYTHYEDNLEGLMNGVATRASLPVARSLAATIGASVASARGGQPTLQGMAGGIWGLTRRVLLLGEVSVGRNVITITGGSPTERGPSGLGIGGQLPLEVGVGQGPRAEGPTTENGTPASALLGLRLVIP